MRDYLFIYITNLNQFIYCRTWTINGE